MSGLKLLGAIFICLHGVLSSGAQTGRRGGEYDIRGRVTTVKTEGVSSRSPRILGVISVESAGGSPTSGDKATVFITEKTRVYEQGAERREPTKFERLRVGQEVAVRFTGAALMSYPVQATAGEIVIMVSPSSDQQAATDISVSQAPADRPDVAAVRRAVEAGNATWVRAWARGDAASVVATFTPDGSLLAQGGRVVKGRRRLLEYVRDWMRRLGGSAKLSVTTTDLWLDGDTAYETGIARYEYTANNQPNNLERRYFTVWRRQRDNTWKIFMDVGVPQNQVAVKSGTAAVNGTKLYYEITGAGHPLVLVNGSSLDRTMWDEQVGPLSAHYRITRYDIRGIGRSATPDGAFSHSQDLHYLLKFLGVEKAHVIGLSFGEAFAIDFALEHPEMSPKPLQAIAEISFSFTS